jgi:hypothetical protein
MAAVNVTGADLFHFSCLGQLEHHFVLLKPQSAGILEDKFIVFREFLEWGLCLLALLS